MKFKKFDSIVENLFINFVFNTSSGIVGRPLMPIHIRWDINRNIAIADGMNLEDACFNTGLIKPNTKSFFWRTKFDEILRFPLHFHQIVDPKSL